MFPAVLFLAFVRHISTQMSFQPVPPQTELQGLIPAGRMAVALRVYAQPTPAFGPGSVEYARQRAEALELVEGGESAEGSIAPMPGANNYSTDRPYY
jgi:hypothetical protein